MPPIMTPAPADRLLRYVGDRVRFELRFDDAPEGTRAFVRTNLGRMETTYRELVESLGSGQTFAGSSWRDLPLTRAADGSNRWSLDLVLNEPATVMAKAYAVDARGRQHWPTGDNLLIGVHPDYYRTANTIYCAFVRMFGASKSASSTRQPLLDEQLSVLDRHSYTAIPPSGTLRDLTAQIPHIVSTLGCGIIHLLPVSSTPTTYARFGRFGSPYACQDLIAIDPALAEFDQRTTVVDQFRELTYAAHQYGARVLLDIVINHTGWGSTLLNEHPEWFKRKADGAFHSPGAWGNTWADLVELDNEHNPALWATIAEALLVWCRRGVDGFRCDAGYMVPLPAWQYIISRVRLEFPEALFLLEGLGGAWEVTERLLTLGGMDWAYSELFQNYQGHEVATYLDHCIRQANRVGVLIHYSETHDNERLAARGATWSLMRNRLAALTSVSGGFGFTGGVEWLAAEKIEVHQSRGMNWGAQPNLVGELSRLNRLLAEHPAFFDGARLTRLSADDAPVLALRRDAAEGTDAVLVLVNLDVGRALDAVVPESALRGVPGFTVDLLGQPFPPSTNSAGVITFRLAPGASHCLAASATPQGLAGVDYRHRRAQAAWAYRMLGHRVDAPDLGPCNWHDLAAWVAADPVRFLAAVAGLDGAQTRADLLGALMLAAARADLPQVVRWGLADLSRVVPVPPGHCLLIRDDVPFSATLTLDDDATPRVERSVVVDEGHIVGFPPVPAGAHATLLLERFTDHGRQVIGAVRFLGPLPDLRVIAPATSMALLTNGRGGMARIPADLGTVYSKYDAVLAANLHATAPCDRQVLVKRLRAWVNADGFISPLDRTNLIDFTAGPPARWCFVANAGDGRTVEIHLDADLLQGRNTTVLRFSCPRTPPARGRPLPDGRSVRLIVRLDLEDRNFHSETRRSPECEQHFTSHTTTLTTRAGCVFAPAPERVLTISADAGEFHADAEWCEHIPHPIEASRGLTAEGDAWSPGWFELPLERGDAVHVVCCADATEPEPEDIIGFAEERRQLLSAAVTAAAMPENDAFATQLAQALTAYVVRRGTGRTVIAGYPWFLDWGRDTLIAARGMLAAGMIDEVRQILLTFARFEENGTLPNMLNGDDASNRDTSDAALWFGVVCEELAELAGPAVYDADVGGRRLRDVLSAIARGHLAGTPNGIRVDVESALVFSPPHFTWMDTNHPACTPRQGYPIEIQVLWIRLLRQLDRLTAPTAGEAWATLATRATASLERFWLEDRGWFADVLLAQPGQSAADSTPDNALRSNGLLAVALGIVEGTRARRIVAAALRYLVVPGALRSLAPLPVEPPLENRSSDGRLLNNPTEPYWGHYAGDEDTRRKPAYHNGTAWTWTYPVFCEALARAWTFSPAATAAARSYLSAMDLLLTAGAIGHIPEIIDGDAPHAQRGCDAQAWGVSEALRVWKLLATRG